MRYAEGKNIVSATLNRTPDPRIPGADPATQVRLFLGNLVCFFDLEQHTGHEQKPFVWLDVASKPASPCHFFP